MGIISGGGGGGGTTLSGWSVAGNPANVNSNAGGLTIGAGGFLEIIDGGIDVDAGGVELFDTSPLTLHGGAVITTGGDVRTSGGDVDTNGGDLGTVLHKAGTVYAASTVIDDGNRINAVGGGVAVVLNGDQGSRFEVNGAAMGFFGAGAVARQTIHSGTATPESLALALEASTLMTGD